ncbi:MAG: transposase [Actinobacteria bacterium]|nr:transposase [Actinomycetota bacterium]
MIGLIDRIIPTIKKRNRGRPYVYSTTIILRCFIVRIWFRLDSNRALHHFLSIDLPYNRKITEACGLSNELPSLPNRRTFDRRLKTISTDIKERIATMGHLFVLEEIIKPYILAVDSTLLRSKGKVWHNSSMKKGIVPRQGIDTDARWGFSHTRGWIFGYKLHMVSSTGSTSVGVPLTAEITTANVPDNQVYPALVSSLPSESVKKIHYMVADPGYDDHYLYELSTNQGFQLVCPIRQYKNTPMERLQLIDFYKSPLGQVIYSKRSTSIEPLIGHVKSIFRIDPVPVRGYEKVGGIVLLSVLLYQLLVYHNCKMQKNSTRAIKYMIGC